MAKLIDYKKIGDYSNQTFILDTNVWLYIQSDIHKCDYGYSKILEVLLENEARILLPPLVATEFINRYCRLKYQVIIDKINEENKSKKIKIKSRYHRIKLISDLHRNI